VLVNKLVSCVGLLSGALEILEITITSTPPVGITPETDFDMVRQKGYEKLDSP